MQGLRIRMRSKVRWRNDAQKMEKYTHITCGKKPLDIISGAKSSALCHRRSSTNHYPCLYVLFLDMRGRTFGFRLGLLFLMASDSDLVVTIIPYLWESIWRNWTQIWWKIVCVLFRGSNPMFHVLKPNGTSNLHGGKILIHLQNLFQIKIHATQRYIQIH